MVSVWKKGNDFSQRKSDSSTRNGIEGIVSPYSGDVAKFGVDNILYRIIFMLYMQSSSVVMISVIRRTGL